MVGKFKKNHFYRPVKILLYLTPVRIQKYIPYTLYLQDFLDFLTKKPPANLVVHKTRGFLTCYSWSCYTFLLKHTKRMPTATEIQN